MVKKLAPADDFSDADRTKILYFSQAQAKARELMVYCANQAAGKTGPITVKDAVDAYIDFLETNRKSARFSLYTTDAVIRLSSEKDGHRSDQSMALRMSDFNLDGRQSKFGKPRYVVLTRRERAGFFQSIAAGRAGEDFLFTKHDSGPWSSSHQKEPMCEANKHAGIVPPINFHGLGHTWPAMPS